MLKMQAGSLLTRRRYYFKKAETNYKPAYRQWTKNTTEGKFECEQ